MKKILISALLFCALKSHAQQVDTSGSISSIVATEKLQQKRNSIAGKEMIKFSRQIPAAIVCEFAGGVIAAIGIANSNKTTSNGYVGGSSQDPENNQYKVLTYFGAGIGLLGFIVQMTAYKHLEKAGIALRGNSVSVSF